MNITLNNIKRVEQNDRITTPATREKLGIPIGVLPMIYVSELL